MLGRNITHYYYSSFNFVLLSLLTLRVILLNINELSGCFE